MMLRLRRYSLLILSLVFFSSHAADARETVEDTRQAFSSSRRTKTCFGQSLQIPPDSPKQHLVIAHRGASAHLPEHTLAAYQLALELGADFIEPDLVSTSDGQLVALHTSDLTVTTNVAKVFGDSHEPWFSPFSNRSSYWAFNFTANELRQLKVKQRLPDARSIAYDYQFGIPMLYEIVDLLNGYNVNLLSKLLVEANETPAGTTVRHHGPTRADLAQAGLYAELKDSVWLRQEAGLDLVELLLRTIEDQKEGWDPLLKCFSNMKHDEYKVPGLVIQSFDPDALQRFREQWPDAFSFDNYAPPPSILLVSAPDCWADEFWFQLGDHWRSFVDGLGPDKKCMLNNQSGPAFLEKAREFDMVLHPWTERPESIYLSEGFDNVVDETKHLYCQCDVQAVFSESVSTAVAAIAAGCDADSSGGSVATLKPSQAPTLTNASDETADIASNDICAKSTTGFDVYVAASAFVIGAALTLFASCYFRRRASQTQGFAGRRRVPSFESDLELT